VEEKIENTAKTDVHFFKLDAKYSRGGAGDQR
jgi:hypothetical protein